MNLLALVFLAYQAADLNTSWCAAEISDHFAYEKLSRSQAEGQRWLLGVIFLDTPPPGIPEILFLRPEDEQAGINGGIGHAWVLPLCSPVFAGVATEVPQGRLERFAVVKDPDSPFYLLTLRRFSTLEAVSEALEKIQQRFHAGDLAYWPRTLTQRREAQAWPPGALPVVFESLDKSFQAYAVGANCGRLRILDAQLWAAAHQAGALTREDILVLEEVPPDFDVRVAGVVTATPQGPLSHANILAMQEGTPNAFIKGALARFAGLKDKLVFYEVTEDGYTLREATLQEARRIWEQRKPKPLKVRKADLNYSAMPSLEEISGTYRPDLFGGKAANLAAFLPFIPEPNRVKGFVIPFSYLREYLSDNTIGDITFAEAYARLQDNPRFQSDSAYRKQKLEEFQEYLRTSGRVRNVVIERIAERIEAVFGSETVKVRFRSSSNAEDSLFFPGAGLYSSTSACAADSLDSDHRGPCRCDPRELRERTIERALRKVWASLWNFQAYELRRWYGIEESNVSMAVLVTPAFVDEAANGVALTGSPTDPTDSRFYVSAQPGDTSVVRPEPGQIPELDLLAVTEQGRLVVERVRPSNLVFEGTFVLQEEELSELASLLSSLAGAYKPPEGVPEELVRLNVEFKLSSAHRIIIKQVRPYVLPGTRRFVSKLIDRTLYFPARVFVNAASGTEPAVTELKKRIVIELTESALSVSPKERRRSTSWIKEVRYGLEGMSLKPGEPAGVRTAIDYSQWVEGVATLNWDISQKIPLPDGGELEIQCSVPPLRLNVWRNEGEGHLQADRLRGLRNGKPAAQFLPLEGSPLPVYLLNVRVSGNDRVNLLFTGPTANKGAEGCLVLGARGRIAGKEFFVCDPTKLAVGKGPYPVRLSYLVVLGPGTPHAFSVRFIVGRIEPSVAVLDEAFQPIGELQVSSWSSRLYSTRAGTRFLRGDANGDGDVGLPDAIFTLQALFAGGPQPECPDAADANDDGRINISDVVLLLRWTLGASAVRFLCEVDRSQDELSPCRYELWTCVER